MTNEFEFEIDAQMLTTGPVYAITLGVLITFWRAGQCWETDQEECITMIHGVDTTFDGMMAWAGVLAAHYEGAA